MSVCWSERTDHLHELLVFLDLCVFMNVIVNVPPANDEQAVRVPKTGEQVKRRAQAG